MDKIFVSGMKFVDEHGRERIFSGMNVVDKKEYLADNPSYGYPAETFPFEEFRARGYDIIRLGFTWGAMEPKPGKYNEQLIESLCAFLDKCEEHGIYAYLDCHQDVWSPQCYGDGAPHWATITDQFKPRKPIAVWAEPYFYGKACHRAFDNFWDNKKINRKGLQDYYADMWKHVVKATMDKPALFGYDFFNEPFPGADGGKIFKKIIAGLVKTTITDKRVNILELAKVGLFSKEKPKALDQYPGEVFKNITTNCNELVKNFDENRYSPFLSKMTSAIREITDKGIIFMENNYYSNMGIPCCNKPASVNGERESQQVFAPHAYDLMVDTPAYKYASNSRVGMIFDQHRATQERLQVPCLVGEWGSCAEGDGWYPHIRFLQDKFDSYKWSNTYWCYFDGILEQDFMKVLTRPRPKAVTGEIVSYKYNHDEGEFKLKYKQDKKFKVPTVVYVDRKPKEIECDGKYEIIELPGNIGYDIEFKTDIGEHEIEIEF
ncbi:MAG: cellulase family glycosylhydrolase [Clostridia bacterium]|nr:cellulase family glycosylhydrolase [Clostridia bacterium]